MTSNTVPPLNHLGNSRLPSAVPLRNHAKPIRTLLINNEDIVKAGLKSLLVNSPDIQLVTEADTVQEALDALASTPADLVILDLELSNVNCLDMLRQLVEAKPELRILLLAGQNDIELCLEAVKLGGSGIVRKSETSEVLAEAMRRVAAGEAWLDGKVVKALLEEFWKARRGAGSFEIVRSPQEFEREAPSGEDARKIATLTPREREIIALVGSGMRNHHLAEHLCISPATARHHLTSIYEKLEVGDRFELAIYAYRHGLATVPR